MSPETPPQEHFDAFSVAPLTLNHSYFLLDMALGNVSDAKRHYTEVVAQQFPTLTGDQPTAAAGFFVDSLVESSEDEFILLFYSSIKLWGGLPIDVGRATDLEMNERRLQKNYLGETNRIYNHAEQLHLFYGYSNEEFRDVASKRISALVEFERVVSLLGETKDPALYLNAFNEVKKGLFAYYFNLQKIIRSEPR